MSKEKRLYFNTLVTKFKKSDASDESVEAIFDFIYLLEEKKRDHHETILLVEVYSLLGLHQKAYDLFLQLKTHSFSSKETKKHQKKLQELVKNTKLDTRFYYRDLRQARIPKEATILTKNDFSVTLEEESHLVKIHETINSIVVLNKYVPNADIFISADELNFNLIQSYIVWLGNCKQELIDFYNQHTFDHKIERVDEKWFHGLDVWDVEIEIKEGSIYGNITITDYFNGNLGFHLETKDYSIYAIEYDPIL